MERSPMTCTLRRETESSDIRPYQLTGEKYALWSDCRVLGMSGQTAVGHYLCGGSKIITPRGEGLDERSHEIVAALAIKRGVFIPATAY